MREELTLGQIISRGKNAVCYHGTSGDLGCFTYDARNKVVRGPNFATISARKANKQWRGWYVDSKR